MDQMEIFFHVLWWTVILNGCLVILSPIMFYRCSTTVKSWEDFLLRYFQSFITMKLWWHLWLVYYGRDLVSDFIVRIHIVQTLFTLFFCTHWCCMMSGVLPCIALLDHRHSLCRDMLSQYVFILPFFCELFSIFIFKHALTDFL
jgi:hypothetical protein